MTINRLISVNNITKIKDALNSQDINSCEKLANIYKKKGIVKLTS